VFGLILNGLVASQANPNYQPELTALVLQAPQNVLILTIYSQTLNTSYS